MFKIAVFVSGRGSNLLSIASNIENGHLKAEISVVISNSKSCKALEYAASKNIKKIVVSDQESGNECLSYSDLLVQLSELKIDLIVLAGYLKKIPNDLIRNYKNKIINIHPALLPSFGGKGMYGSNVHKAVFNSSVKVSGPTVHFVDEIYDNGLIIDQKCTDISDVNSYEEIAERVLKLEHKLLPEVIHKFTENKIRIDQNRVFID
jgi:formyltetrahydrofolate-dependent phosphoribosylglycinamide formyltransferase